MVGGEKVKMTDIIVDMFSLQESSKELSKAIAKLNTVDENFQHTPSYRYLVVLDYRIYYFTEDQTVYIAAIWDCRQGGRVFKQR